MSQMSSDMIQQRGFNSVSVVCRGEGPGRQTGFAKQNVISEKKAKHEISDKLITLYSCQSGLSHARMLTQSQSSTARDRAPQIVDAYSDNHNRATQKSNRARLDDSV